MAGPLAGLTVVDFSWGYAGAVATQFLADYGAEVIKVEPPQGDPIRHHAGFPMWFRGKKSAVLDFKRPQELAAAQRLAANADIVVETFRPGVARRLGLAYEDLSKENPGLILCSITAFGTKGPYARLKGYEAIVHAKIGASDHMRNLAPRPGPAFSPLPAAGFSAAQTALHGILAALHVRHKTGLGQRAETTMIQAWASHDPWMGFIEYLCEKYPEAYKVTPMVPVAGTPITSYAFRLLVAMTKDGRWVQFSQTAPHLWKALERGLDIEAQIQADPAFKNAPEMETYADSVRFWDLLLNAVRSRTLTEWQERFKQHPDVGMEVFLSPQEAAQHPQMLHNGHILELADPRFGKTRQLAPMVKLSATPPAPPAPAPDLGQHTKEVLSRPFARPKAPAKPAASIQGKPPLEGITAIELGHYYAAPYGLTILASLGARVVKLEPLRGDDMRIAMPIPETAAVKVLEGKESVAVNLETPQGREIAARLVQKADLLMTSFRGGVTKRLGLDYPTLRQINPNLVYLNSPAYGVDGPYSRIPAYASTIGAGMGYGFLIAGPKAQNPDPDRITMEELKALTTRLRVATTGGGNPDGLAALGVGTALLLGLVARDRTGMAQEMLTTMIGTAAQVNAAEMIQYAGKPPTHRTDPDLNGLHALHRLYKAADAWVMVACLQEEDWQAFARAIAPFTPDKASPARDPRFASHASRLQNDAALAQRLGMALASRTAKEWEDLFLPLDVPCVKAEPGPIFSGIYKSPVFRENGFISDVTHPIFGGYPRLAPLCQLSLTSGVAKPGVVLGQHTELVLKNLGYSEEQIETLEQTKVIGRGRV
jgi:crotonobetainyl-CoA:carnitine CoA-transferase CaiB-like acyl-CoA transferase